MEIETNKTEHLKKDLGKKQKSFLVKLSENLGNITQTCQEAEISRTTFYQWKQDFEGFADAVEAIDDEVLDWVESNAMERIKEKSDTMIIFYLKTKGKKRGYVERNEISGANGNPIETKSSVDLSKLDESELIAFNQLLEKTNG